MRVALLFLALSAAEVQPLTPADLGKLLADSPQPVVVNVWATWCVPCVEEFPELLAWRKANIHRARLVLVSADFSSRVALVVRFLQERGVNFTTYLKEGPDELLIATLSPQWSGALPATFVFAPGGRLVAFREGKVTTDELDRMLAKALKEKGGHQ